MRQLWVSLFLCSLACWVVGPIAVAPQPVPTTLPTTYPTTAPTTVPTTYPTTAPTTIPAYATSVPTTYPTTAATTAPTTRPTIVPGTPPPLHVLTAAYLTNAQQVATNPAIFAPYFSLAYTKSDQLGAMQKTGIATVYYTNPLQPICNSTAVPCASGDYQGYNFLNTGGTYTSAAVHDCSGVLITGHYGTLPALFADPRATNSSTYVQATEDALLAYLVYANPGYSHPATYLFIDNATPTLYAPVATPCPSPTPATWDAAIGTTIGGTTDGPYIVNTLARNTTSGVASALTVIRSAQVWSGEYEGCYGSNSPSNIVAAFGATFDWNAVEYAEIQTLLMGKVFWCYMRMSGDGAAWIPQRVYCYASWLLTYDAKTAIYQTALSGGATYGGPPIFPEMQLVPLNPTTTQTAVSGYLQGSVYVRRWSDCLYIGVDMGPCAVAINPSPTATASTPSGYSRAMALQGDGVFDGGTASFNGPSSATLAPTTAAVLLP